MVVRTMVFAMLFSSGVTFAEPPAKPVGIGEAVGDFSVTLSDGTTWKLSEFRKQRKQKAEDPVVVLTFWCSFCHSCRHVEGPLDEMAKQYRGRALVLAVDSSVGETVEGVAAFKKKKRLTLPIGLDPEGNVADLLGARTTTTTAIIDGQGVLRYFGQFGHGKERPAEAALKAVLADGQVRVDHTAQRG